MTLSMRCPCGNTFYERTYKDTRGACFCSEECARAEREDVSDFYRKLMEGSHALRDRQ